MEEVVNRNVFEVIIASISGAIGFLYAWITRNTIRTNRMSELLATIAESNKNQSSEIRDIKTDIKAIRSDIRSINLAITKSKEIHYGVLARVNKVLDELGE